MLSLLFNVFYLIFFKRYNRGNIRKINPSNSQIIVITDSKELKVKSIFKLCLHIIYIGGTSKYKMEPRIYYFQENKSSFDALNKFYSSINQNTHFNKMSSISFKENKLFYSGHL